MSSKRTEKYKKLDQISHVLQRPDTYIGSVRPKDLTEYIASPEFKISQKKIKISPGLLRIFVEALSNAVDNVTRSKTTKTKCTEIRVSIDKNTGVSSVWNDGEVIPIEIHSEGCYTHSLIFGQLLTGSNYNDDEERLVSGRNGIGIKALGVFSSSFLVEGADPHNGLRFSQRWTENLRKPEEPKITKTKEKKGWTKVEWVPDFEKFGISGYTTDIIDLYRKYTIDATMLSGVKVTSCDVEIPAKSLKDYALLYGIGSEDFGNTPEEVIEIKHEGSQVLLVPSNGEFQSISFVNGVYTKLGGTHVDSWSEAFFRPIVDKFNGKDLKTAKKTPKINITDVKRFFWLFVVCSVDKPEFNSQEKERLESPTVPADVKKKHQSIISKWSVWKFIEDTIRTKELATLRKTETKKKNVFIEGYDQANNAGTVHSSECTLILCEGLSAKTLAIAGIENELFGKSGRSWFGILPLRGKVLNTRNATSSSISANKVVTNIIQALRLRYGLDYSKDENFRTLSYGKLLLMADGDVDGVHIEALIMNLLHSLFPTLFNRKDPFVISMKTPIVRVFGTKGDTLFYDERNFLKWYSEKPQGKIKMKYYKGLGTIKSEDIEEIYGKKLVNYVNDDMATDTMNKVFHKKMADERKEWLAAYNKHESEFSLDHQDSICELTLSQFLDWEMIKFSHADCARSIPSCIDGLKESQRKILFAVFKRKLSYFKESVKVAQLCGYVAEHSAYHHGEQNLYTTLAGMATSFVGSNNIPLFYRDGAFGSRNSGGEDAANARYIYTKMDMLTDKIYRSEDEPLLTAVIDDGQSVQPEFYVPIIPMILVNGCVGIGTGWSSNIPSYNPKDLIVAVKTWITNGGDIFREDEEGNITSILEPLTPWYRGFTGAISPHKANTFITEGCYSADAKGKISVTELPVRMWTDSFKERCEDLVEKKLVKKINNFSTTTKVNFVLDVTDAFQESDLHLFTYLHTSNMCLFDENEVLSKYGSVDEIIDKFCTIRMEFYVKRRLHNIDSLEKELKHLGNKARFIREVIDGEVEFMNKPEAQVIDRLEKRGYDKDPETNDYEYLLRLQVRTFTEEKVKSFLKDIDSLTEKLEENKKMTPGEIWLKELDEFEDAYEKWLVAIEKEETKKKKSNPKASERKKKKAL